MGGTCLQDRFGGVDIPDFVPQTFDAPVLGGFVYSLSNVNVQGCALLQHMVQRKLSNLGAHRGLGELRDGVFGILNSIGCFVCIEYSNIEHALYVSAPVGGSPCPGVG